MRRVDADATAPRREAGCIDVDDPRKERKLAGARAVTRGARGVPQCRISACDGGDADLARKNRGGARPGAAMSDAGRERVACGCGAAALPNSGETPWAAGRMPALRGVIALALWLVMSAHGWSQVTVTRGPYLQRASTNGIVIRWRTNVVTGSWVFFGPAPGNLPSLFVDAPGTEHAVTITGLAPGEVLLRHRRRRRHPRGADAQHFFFTAPPVGSERRRAHLLGDSGTAATAPVARNPCATRI